jgi:hypothetical protein
MDTVSFFNYGFNKGGGNHLNSITDGTGKSLEIDKSRLSITDYSKYTFNDTAEFTPICNQQGFYCVVKDDRLKQATGKKKAKLISQNASNVAQLQPFCLMISDVYDRYIGLSKSENPTTLEEVEYLIEIPNSYDVPINIQLENLSDYYIHHFLRIDCIPYPTGMDEMCGAGCGQVTVTFTPPEIEFS